MDLADQTLTAQQLDTLIAIFIKCYLLLIFKERNLYPATSFTLRQAFRLALPWNRHPYLNDWLDGLVESLINNRRQLSALTVVLFDEKDGIKERYVLDMSRMSLLKDGRAPTRTIESFDVQRLYDEFRGCLHSLMKRMRSLEPASGWRFEVGAEGLGQGLEGNWVRDVTESQIGIKMPQTTVAVGDVTEGSVKISSMIEVYGRN